MTPADYWRAELWQDGMMVARVIGETRDDVEVQINHYAFMYSQDGPVKVKIKAVRKR